MFEISTCFIVLTLLAAMAGIFGLAYWVSLLLFQENDDENEELIVPLCDSPPDCFTDNDDPGVNGLLRGATHPRAAKGDDAEGHD